MTDFRVYQENFNYFQKPKGQKAFIALAMVGIGIHWLYYRNMTIRQEASRKALRQISKLASYD